MTSMTAASLSIGTADGLLETEKNAGESENTYILRPVFQQRRVTDGLWWGRPARLLGQAGRARLEASASVKGAGSGEVGGAGGGQAGAERRGWRGRGGAGGEAGLERARRSWDLEGVGLEYRDESAEEGGAGSGAARASRGGGGTGGRESIFLELSAATRS